MIVHDISMEVSHDMPVYKGKAEKRPVFTTDSDFASGTFYETRLEMNLHTGTHLDAPLHMIPDGETIDSLDLNKVVTRCRVLDFSEVQEKITDADLLLKEIEEGDFILLKTKSSFLDILEKDFIYLDKTGAKYLAEKGVKGVGIDSLGIERAQPGHETHKILFEQGIAILEGLRLKDIEEGEYLLAAAPVKIAGAEAAPVRAILIEMDK